VRPVGVITELRTSFPLAVSENVAVLTLQGLDRALFVDANHQGVER